MHLRHKNNYFAIQLGTSIMLLSFAFVYIYYLSSGVSQVPRPPIENTNVRSTVVSSDPEVNKDEIPQVTAKDCDLFNGEWIANESGPLYTNETCSFIEDPQNCLLNGRTDTGYLYWSWKPHGCELPRFDSRRFLDAMHNKVLGMIGDSISRNQAQSLLCMLSKVEKAVLVYHNESFKSRKWLFPSYNFTISLIWSPLLAKAAISEDANGVPSSEIELHLDVLDNSWTEHYINLDYVLFATGSWFTKNIIYYENNTVIGCSHCSTRNLTEFDFHSTHRKVIRKVYEYIVASNHKGIIIYRTTPPSHFENGEWDSGGTCNRTTPDSAGELELKYYEKIFHDTELEEFDRAVIKASENGVRIKLLDVSYLSLLRPDGHAGLDRYFQKLIGNEKPISDCLHWCVPGPIDYWNDLLMEILL